MSPPPAAPLPTLPDELLEEVFLRLPPDEPAFLVRCSLASKPWHGLLTGPAFRGRYRDFHAAPPMLGFFHSRPSISAAPFVPTAKFGAEWSGGLERLVAWDCRHGRALLCYWGMLYFELFAWDPMTDRRTMLGAPKPYHSQHGAVLCAIAGCDHRACHEGPFRVVLVGLNNTDDGCVVHAHVFLPEAVNWSKPCATLNLTTDDTFLFNRTPVFIQDALYFMLRYAEDDDSDDAGIAKAILKYDLGSNLLSLIDAPQQVIDPADNTILTAMEDGSLGFAHVDGLVLNLWSRNTGSNGVAAWTQRSVIDLKTVIPDQNPKKRLRLIGSVEGTDVIFVTTDTGIYQINLKSLLSKKIWESGGFRELIPYMSFYNPPERVSRRDAAH